MKYLKEFATAAEYTAAQSSLILPNVSLVTEDNTVHYNPYVDPYAGHDYVEIGGVKWATMNIGANSITDAGLYFQWGDISGYTAAQVGTDKVFDWANYKYWTSDTGSGSSGFTKYNRTDDKTVLDLSDDAARANWGGGWRMPTTAEFQALGAVCSTVWTTTYEGSASGMLLTVTADTADNGKQLFFPACGHAKDSSVLDVGSFGDYWSSSLYVYMSRVYAAYYFVLGGNGVNWRSTTYRYEGFTVRPVVG